jgi:class 3 adenylate cyclase
VVLMPRTIQAIGSKKRIAREQHDRIVANYVSKVRSVGEANATSKVVGAKNRHKALRMNSASSRSLDPEPFGLELEVKMVLSHSGEVKFRAFMRDTHSIVLQSEQAEAVIASQAFPRPIIEELKRGQNVDGERDLSVIFCDIVGFTSLASMLEDNTVLALLSDMFGRFRDIKGSVPSFDPIKTNYDEMMATVGLDPSQLSGSHADDAVRAALAMLEAVQEFNADTSNSVGIRIGIDSGLVLCGLIGGERSKCFDLVGNVSVGASRAENTGERDQIHITENTYSLLSEENKKLFKQRAHKVQFKNIGERCTYLSDRKVAL